MFSIQIQFKNSNKVQSDNLDCQSGVSAILHAHSVALNDSNIKSVMVRNANGNIIGGFSRAVGNLKSIFSKA